MPTKTKYDLKMGMATREAFGKTLAKLGAENKDIVVCDADLSKSTYTSFFAKDFPCLLYTSRCEGTESG